MKTAYSIAVIAVLAFALARFSRAGDLPTSFKEAAALAEAQNDQQAHALRDYMEDDLAPYYKKKYGPLFVSCLKSNPDTTHFEFIIAIGKDGKVLRLFSDRDTNMFTCVRDTLERDEFPHPPIAPFYWRIQMSFSAPEPAQLQIHSTPDAADIEIDGKYVGSTPSTMSVSPGQHQICMKKTGFKIWGRQITVSTGQVNVNAALEAEQQ